MAAILIVEHDLEVARWMARALRLLGHTPNLAPNAPAALAKALDMPDLIVLDAGLPDGSWENLVQELKSRPETARIPLLLVSERAESATRPDPAETAGVATVLFKPVSVAQLQEAVTIALEGPRRLHIGEDLRLAQHWRRELIRKLIVEGPDRIAFHVYRRLSADRTKAGSPKLAEALTWGQIGEWARLEGLLDKEQAELLCHDMLVRAETRDGSRLPPDRIDSATAPKEPIDEEG